MMSYSSINYADIFGMSAGIIQNIMYGVRILTTIIGFFLFIIVQKNYHNKRLNIYFKLLFFFLIVLFSGMVHSNLTIEIILKYCLALGLYFYIIYCSIDYDALIKGLLMFFKIILLLNIIYYFFNPSVGVYTTLNGLPLLKGILINRNSVLLYTLPIIILNNIANIKNELKIKIINIISFIVILLTGSDTAFIVSFFYLVMKFSHKRTINIKFYLCFFFIIFICLIFLNFENNIFGYIIVNIVGSDLTLSGRTIIWNRVLSLVSQKIILGYGIGSNMIAEVLSYKNATNGMPLNDPFNGFLNILFFNGVIGILMFINILREIFTKLYKYQFKDSNAKQFIIMMLSFILISFSESIFQFTYFIFWIFLILIYEYKTNEDVKKDKVIKYNLM